MAVYVSNIVIDQGFDFSTIFGLEDARTNSALNLTGYGATSQLRKSPSSLTAVSFASTVIDALVVAIQISLTSEQTLNLRPGRYVYDVMLEYGGVGSGGNKYKAVEGMVLVRAGVTH